MALKKNKDGTYRLDSEKDLQQVALAIEEREAARAEIEKRMEEEYDYSSMGDEINQLREAMRTFMADNDVAHVFRDNYQVTLIRRTRNTWDADKLKALVPKGLFMRVVKLTVDPDKIDDMVREGKLDERKIAPALKSVPEKPHIRTFPYKEGQSRDEAVDEAKRVREQMSKDAVVASGSKRKAAK